LHGSPRALAGSIFESDSLAVGETQYLFNL
jgi:hypothetical protein